MFPFQTVFGQTARLFHTPEIDELREGFAPARRRSAADGRHTDQQGSGSAGSDRARDAA